MSIKETRQSTLHFLGNYFADTVINLLCKSLNISVKNDEHINKLLDENKNFVLAFWHETMLAAWFAHSGKNIAALTSKSKDGDLLAKLLKGWNYKVVRGSSSSGGDVALGIMIDYAKNKYSIAITPDGPRGPKNKFKAGAVVTAKKSKIPIILAGIGIKKKKKLSNWDNFEIPHFFTKVNIHYSETIYVDSNLSYEEVSKIILDCENKLNELQNAASKFDW